MILKLFTQSNCGRCPAAKGVVKKFKVQSSKCKVEEYDTTMVDGMAEASFYTVMATPTILLCDDKGKIIKDWRGEAPSPSAIRAAIK
jgi:thioredoxin-related protein